jgi:hypothetical protein
LGSRRSKLGPPAHLAQRPPYIFDAPPPPSRNPNPPSFSSAAASSSLLAWPPPPSGRRQGPDASPPLRLRRQQIRPLPHLCLPPAQRCAAPSSPLRAPLTSWRGAAAGRGAVTVDPRTPRRLRDVPRRLWRRNLDPARHNLDESGGTTSAWRGVAQPR